MQESYITSAQAVEMSQKYLMAQARHQLYDEPVVFSKGKMELLYDTEGKEYVDCFSGIMVANFGHCNPEINESLHRQLDTLQHVSTFFFSEPLLKLAEKIAEITPEGLQRSYFVNSGSEAVDSAILLARTYTGNELIVPVRYGYHGRTLLDVVCTNVSPSLAVDARCEKQDVAVGQNGYCYRCPKNKSYPGCNLECTQDVEALIQEKGGKIAAIVVEPVQGVGGVITPPDAWLKKMEELAHAAGGLLIVDEVQCGFGRTGHNFYSSNSSMKPDILTMAKGIANGMPLGAFVAKDEIGEAMKIPTFATFGASPFTATAGLASIEYMQKHDVPAMARKSGERFRKGIEELQKKHRLIGDVRGQGLFLAMELVRDAETKEPAGEETLRIINRCKELGGIFGKSGPKTNVIRVGPPLIIRDEYIDRALSILDEAFTDIENG